MFGARGMVSLPRIELDAPRESRIAHDVLDDVEPTSAVSVLFLKKEFLCF